MIADEKVIFNNENIITTYNNSNCYFYYLYQIYGVTNLIDISNVDKNCSQNLRDCFQCVLNIIKKKITILNYNNSYTKDQLIKNIEETIDLIDFLLIIREKDISSSKIKTEGGEEGIQEIQIEGAEKQVNKRKYDRYCTYVNYPIFAKDLVISKNNNEKDKILLYGIYDVFNISYNGCFISIGLENNLKLKNEYYTNNSNGCIGEKEDIIIFFTLLIDQKEIEIEGTIKNFSMFKKNNGIGIQFNKISHLKEWENFLSLMHQEFKY